jgi:septal ring factor EnvC (AmiA/AmiB activator)
MSKSKSKASQTMTPLTSATATVTNTTPVVADSNAPEPNKLQQQLQQVTATVTSNASEPNKLQQQLQQSEKDIINHEILTSAKSIIDTKAAAVETTDKKISFWNSNSFFRKFYMYLI